MGNPAHNFTANMRVGPSLTRTGSFRCDPKLGLVEVDGPEPVLGPRPVRAVRVHRDGQLPLMVTLYPDKEYQFGRSPACSVVFTDDAVSRLHGRLACDSQMRWVFRDLGSSNGSLLKREGRQPARLRSSQDVVVEPGQSIVMGTERCWLEFMDSPPEGTQVGIRIDRFTSEVSKRLERTLEVVAHHRLPVFLLGRSGTGKTYAARRIHDASRPQGEFQLINCGSLPSDANALRSELLGHVKGGFTGAINDRLGKLFAADNGTLFLDEVESLPKAAQDFLLDVLEGTGNFSPLGAPADHQQRAPNFRLISASKKPLAQSGLRRDLCQRLSGAFVALPTLDERREDIPAFVQTFLRQHREKQSIDAELTEEALDVLQTARWPGEVRELEQAIALLVATANAERKLEQLETSRLVIGVEAVRAHLLSRDQAFGELSVDDDEAPTETNLVSVLRKRPSDLTRADLEQALSRSGGNKTRAASQLGVALNTLKSRMKALGLG